MSVVLAFRISEGSRLGWDCRSRAAIITTSWLQGCNEKELQYYRPHGHVCLKQIIELRLFLS